MKDRYIAPRALLDDRVSLSFVGNILVLVTTVDSWTDEENIFLMEQIFDIGGLIEKPSLLCQYFGEPFGGKASHRKQLAQWQEEKKIPPTQRIASLTDSLIMRGALTAYSWIIKTEVKPFKSDDIDSACEWIVEGESIKAADIKNALDSCVALVNKAGMQRAG